MRKLGWASITRAVAAGGIAMEEMRNAAALCHTVKLIILHRLVIMHAYAMLLKLNVDTPLVGKRKRPTEFPGYTAPDLVNENFFRT